MRSGVRWSPCDVTSTSSTRLHSSPPVTKNAKKMVPHVDVRPRRHVPKSEAHPTSTAARPQGAGVAEACVRGPRVRVAQVAGVSPLFVSILESRPLLLGGPHLPFFPLGSFTARSPREETPQVARDSRPHPNQGTLQCPPSRSNSVCEKLNVLHYRP